MGVSRFLNRRRYSSREISLRQCPVNMASPVTPTKIPTTSVPNTQVGTLVWVKTDRISNVSFTGHASTQARQPVHSSLHTRLAVWIVILDGHALVHIEQSMQVDSVRVIFIGLARLTIPRKAPYGQRNR